MTTFDLAAWRARMALTQAGAAMLLGTSVRTIAGVEMGERPPSRLLVAACQWHEHQAAGGVAVDRLAEAFDRLAKLEKSVGRMIAQSAMR